jgi:hypothetical protein
VLQVLQAFRVAQLCNMSVLQVLQAFRVAQLTAVAQLCNSTAVQPGTPAIPAEQSQQHAAVCCCGLQRCQKIKKRKRFKYVQE